MGPPTTRLETVVIVSPLKVLCLFFAITSFFCLLISVPSTFWLESENLRFGLWLECKMSELLVDSQTEIDNEIKNKSYQLDCNFIQKVWVQICGSLIIVSLSSSLIGVILICIGFAHKRSQETKFKYYKAATFVFFVAVILMVNSLILFPTMFMQEIKERGKEEWRFGWAYGCAWGSTIFLFGASMLLIFDRNKEEIYYREKVYLNQFEENVEIVKI